MTEAMTGGFLVLWSTDGGKFWKGGEVDIYKKTLKEAIEKIKMLNEVFLSDYPETLPVFKILKVEEIDYESQKDGDD